MTNPKIEILSAQIELVLLGLSMAIAWLNIFPGGSFVLPVITLWLCYALGRLVYFLCYVSHDQLLAIWHSSKKYLTTEADSAQPPIETGVARLTAAQREALGKLVKPCLYILQSKSRWAIRLGIIGSGMLMFPETEYHLTTGTGYALELIGMGLFALSAMDMP